MSVAVGVKPLFACMYHENKKLTRHCSGGTTPGSSQYLQPSNHASGPLITIVDQEACPVNNPPAPAQGPYGSMMTVQEPDSPPKEKDNSNSCKVGFDSCWSKSC